MASLYKTPESKKAILALYQEKLDSLGINYKEQNVDTQFGLSHVIITGDTTKPPLILIHGSNGCAPIALGVYPNLARHYQVFAVDVIAQPNKSSETRPSMTDNSYGIWINELIDALRLNDVTLVGFSLGGFIIWKTLLANEAKIKQAYLIAPVGIVSGNPIRAMFEMFFPMKRFIRGQDNRDLERVLNALFSERDDFAAPFLNKVIPNFDLDFTPIPNISKMKPSVSQRP
ncbi:MAG: alpha/beta hydrolase [Trueperaceae bacterium]|nr:alpha/beta hydrolase [Trueperaceae bacterium]